MTERKTETENQTVQPAFKLDNTAVPKTDAVQEIFDHWREVTGHKHAVLDDKRRRSIKRGLKELCGSDIEKAKRAVTGLGCSDFHMGRDEKSNGKRWDDITLVFRDAAHVENFIACAEETEPEQDASDLSLPACDDRLQDLAGEEFNRFKTAEVEPIKPEHRTLFSPQLEPIGISHVLDCYGKSIGFFRFKDEIVSQAFMIQAVNRAAIARMLRENPDSPNAKRASESWLRSDKNHARDAYRCELGRVLNGVTT